MKIKNIVFDLGNVLIDFSPKEYLEKYITESKRDDFYNAIFPTKEWLKIRRWDIKL
jgi:FMN phosphatase YigB (HAD superfamily)